MQPDVVWGYIAYTSGTVVMIHTCSRVHGNAVVIVVDDQVDFHHHNNDDDGRAILVLICLDRAYPK